MVEFLLFAHKRLTKRNADRKLFEKKTKNRILSLLRAEQMYISEISDSLYVEPGVVIKLLKELKTEKKISVVN